MKKRLIVISSPSGGGKSVVSRHLIKLFPALKFSISATTRPKRPLEEEGVDYYFKSKKEFKKMITDNELVEYEEIFGNFYGTPKASIDETLDSHKKYLLFDVDVKGALSLKKAYPQDTVLIFLMPPSIEVLEERLRRRETESEEQITNRIARAKMEMDQALSFDYIVFNKVLERTFVDVESIIYKHTSLGKQ